MRTNGTLRYSTFTKGGFDDNGVPIGGTQSWSEEIRCSIQTVTNNSNGRYEDGKFSQYSYIVLVEDGRVPLSINRVRLVRGSVNLGDFAIQGLPTPTTMGRIKIVV